MVVIRLSRRGSRHNPKYRVTVADSRRSARGRFIEAIGHYDPQIKTPFIDAKKYQNWIAEGAQASRTVRDLYRRMLNPPDKPRKSGGKPGGSKSSVSDSVSDKAPASASKEARGAQPDRGGPNLGGPHRGGPASGKPSAQTSKNAKMTALADNAKPEKKAKEKAGAG